MEKEKARIVTGGMGGFLNPPTHPEHSYRVETDLRRRKENRGSMSLSAAAKSEWLDDATRSSAQEKLDRWKKHKPAIDDPAVRDWICQVLGYFRGCYRGEGAEPECWNASNLRIIGPNNEDREKFTINDHAGVHFIRTFYPEYVPTETDFGGAYWGTKPEVAA